MAETREEGLGELRRGRSTRARPPLRRGRQNHLMFNFVHPGFEAMINAM